MRVLSVGLSCLDIIQTCKDYPLEDSDQRSIDCRLQRGGNASNICTVLSVLGMPVDYLGSLASGPLSEYLKENFRKYNININDCKIHEECECPVTTIFINSKNGSRTIVHSNINLPEVALNDFKRVNLANYSWIHFEGRNIENVKEMMKIVDNFNKERKRITVSVELEKPKSKLLEIVSLADVVLVGKDFGMKFQWVDMQNTLIQVKKYVKESAIVMCTWGEKGAAVMSPEGKIKEVPAYTPEKVVDTLGAGDSFCAAVIYSLLHKQDPEVAVDFACRLAGCKVGIAGYDGITDEKALMDFIKSW